MFKEFQKTLVIAIPLIISNISQVGLALIDSAMIGPIDYRQLAASSLVINVISVPQVLGIGMTMAISPLVANANGRKDILGASRVLYNGFLISTLAAFIIAIGIVFSSGILYHLGQDPIVAKFAEPYYKVMAWSLIPMVIFMAVKHFTDSLEFTKTAMLLALLSLPLNAVLNYIFIFGKFGIPRLELYGAGIATLITRICLAATLIVIVFRNRLFTPYIAIRERAWKFHLKTWKELLHIGIPTSMQFGMEIAAFSVSGIMVGWLGALPQAAHQIALNLASATFMAALGLSTAGLIRVSNAHGRNALEEVRKIGISTIIGGLTFGVMCGLLFIVFKDHLPYWFTKNAEVAQVAGILLIVAAIFQISDATQAIGVGLLRGIRDVKLPTLYVAIAYWVIGIPVGYLLAFTFNWGVTGIWVGFVSGLSVSSLLLNKRFLNRTHKMILDAKK